MKKSYINCKYFLFYEKNGLELFFLITKLKLFLMKVLYFIMQ